MGKDLSVISIIGKPLLIPHGVRYAYDVVMVIISVHIAAAAGIRLLYETVHGIIAVGCNVPLRVFSA